MKTWPNVSQFLVIAIICFTTEASLGQSNELFNRLVQASKAEMEKRGGKLSVSLHWYEQQAKPVLPAISKDFPFIKEISYERTSEVDGSMRVLMEVQQGRPAKYDIFGVTSDLWPAYNNAGQIVKGPFDYHKLVKSLPSDWSVPDPRLVDPAGLHVFTSGLARGIAYNKNLAPPDKIPKSWDDCLDPVWRGKFLYDPRPKLFALQHDSKTRDPHLKWLKGIVDNKMVPSRGQAEGLEKLAAGEYPLFCGVNYHGAMPLLDEGAPIGFIFVDPIPLELGTPVQVLKWSQTPATTQLFILWLITKAQPLVEKYSYRGFPWDPNSRKYPMAKGKHVAVCDMECASKMEHYLAEHAAIMKLPGASTK